MLFRSKVMQRVYAASKAVRAWTYMQMMLNFGEVTYYEKPLLTLEDAFEDHTVYRSMSELAPVLIQDLEPWKDTPRPDFGSLYTYRTSNSFFPVRFLIGDLYLWTGQYEKAATEYRDLMFFDRVLLSPSFRSLYRVENNAFTGGAFVNWVNSLDFTSSEQLTKVVASNEYQRTFTLDSLIYNRELVPSSWSVLNWKAQVYVDRIGLDTIGDLRWIGTYSTYSADLVDLKDNYSITKYSQMHSDDYETRQIVVYRAPMLYLRYAEAVNRLGKPRLAMAVLKHGLKSSSLVNDMIVPPSEKDSILPGYMNFSDDRFTNNTGVHARGSGNIHLDTTFYVIPRSMQDQDSIILFVEDLIVNEAALELAFEGNRFHDLMRVAIRRDNNAYLADKVAAKHIQNKEAIRTKLMDRKNWYLKK